MKWDDRRIYRYIYVYVSRSIFKRLSLSRERDIVSNIRVVSRENLRRRRSLVRACKSDPKTFARKKLIEVSSWFKHRGRRAIDFAPQSEGSDRRSEFDSSSFTQIRPILPSARLELTLRSGIIERATSRVPSCPPLLLRNWWRAQWRTVFPAFVSTSESLPFSVPHRSWRF